MGSTKRSEHCGTVLTVDDERAVSVLIHTILTAAGYRVLTAGNGADAIRLAGLKHLHIDVALLDVHMPGIRPPELADELCLLRPDIRILFMSGMVDDEVIRIRMLNAYAGFLPKPFRPDGLLRAVRQAMSARGRDHSAATCGNVQPSPAAAEIHRLGPPPSASWQACQSTHRWVE